MERENRYLVIKRKDLYKAKLVADEERWGIFESMVEFINKLREEKKPPLCCVVVEHDWPEYEPTWEAIKRRVYKEKQKTESPVQKGMGWGIP